MPGPGPPAVPEVPEDTSAAEAAPPEPAPEPAPVLEALPGSEAEAALAEESEIALVADALGRRVESLLAPAEAGKRPPESADALYREIDTALRARQRSLARAVILDREGLAEQIAEFEHLRTLRTRTIPLLSPAHRQDVTGLTLRGFRELVRELEAIAIELTYQATAIPRSLPGMLREWRNDPLPVAWSLLLLAFTVFAFRRWRGWAPTGVPAVRERFLRASPRKPYHLRVARLLWYVDRIRSPAEWLALLALLHRLPNAPQVRALADAIWMIASWVLVARIAVEWIDAFGQRRLWQIGREALALRLRSLRLLAAWLVLLGLGLDVADYFSGPNTLYAWTWSVFQLLAIPVAVLLLHWWRDPIFARLERDLPDLPRTASLCESRRGLRGYAGALEAIGLLAASSVFERVVRTVLRIDEGRAVVALVLGRDVTTRTADDERRDTEPIDPQVARTLLDTPCPAIDSVARDSLARLVELARGDRMSAVMITAPRGGGKSQLLGRMAAELGDEMIVVQCLPGGIEPLRAAIAQQLDLRAGWSSEELDLRIRERGLEAIGVDDIHRLIRPVMGGQEPMHQFSEIVRSLESQVLWCGAADRRTWEYIRRAGGEVARVQEVLELGPWSEAEIGALVDRHCEALGLELDFSELELPREIGDVSHVSADAQRRYGFHRMLWIAAEGNPGIALRYLVDSLRVARDGRLVVRRPALPTADDLGNLGLTMLLLLRALVRYSHPTLEDLSAALRVPATEVGNLLVAARTAGWVEELDGRYRITWRWLPAVLRILVRKNLQAR